MLKRIWCFLGSNQSISIVTALGFTVAIWQLYLNRVDRRKSDAAALILWRAEMYEESFANITLSWEELHLRVQSFLPPYRYFSERKLEQLSDYELRLVEVKFRLRGSDSLHALVSKWRDLAMEITHGCSGLRAELIANEGKWQDKDHDLYELIKNELAKLDVVFNDIEVALRKEMQFPN